MDARNRYGARTSRSPESGKNHNRVLPIICILGGIRQVDLVRQIHISVVRIGGRSSASIVFVGELELESFSESGSGRIRARNHHVLKHVVVEVGHSVIRLGQLKEHGTAIGSGIEKWIPSPDD